jgi:formylglycine-generating enzyme required for sulfatase activity
MLLVDGAFSTFGFIIFRSGNRIVMLLIPGGNFVMGANTEDALAECQQFSTDCPEVVLQGETPEQTIYLDDFYMDKFEVTNKVNSKYAPYPYSPTDGREDPMNYGDTARVYRGGACS